MMQSPNAKQINVLTAFMEQYPTLAKSYNSQSLQGRQESSHLWDQLKTKLNAEGPPVKTVPEWKRVWSIRKYRAKAKLVHNKKSLNKTGGGPFSGIELSGNDESIIKACGLEATVRGITGVQAFGSSFNIVENTDNSENIENEKTLSVHGDTSDAAEPFKTMPKIIKSKRSRSNAESDKNALLKQQLKLQREFQEEQKDFHENVVHILKTISNCMVEQTKLAAEHKDKELELRNKELETRLLEIEIARTANENIEYLE